MLHTCITLHVLQVLKNEKSRCPGFLQSPLTDSNRRPPPYHGTSQATGGSRWQRISLVFAISRAGRVAADCHGLQPRGSIKAPSPRPVETALRGASSGSLSASSATLLEEVLLGVGRRQGGGAFVGCRGLTLSTEPTKQIRSRGVERVVGVQV